MMKELIKTELEEAFTLLSYYEEINENNNASILEDINEEMHCAKFLKLLSDNTEHNI